MITQNYGKHLANLRKALRKRPILSQKYRQLIYDTYDGKCAYCGNPTGWSDYEADHVVPFSHGGNTLPTNMVCSCRKCNRAKSASVWDVKYPANDLAKVTMSITYWTQGCFSIWHII